MIKTASLLFLCLLISTFSFSQSNQEKARKMVFAYLANHSKLPPQSNIKISKLEVLNTSYVDTKTYKNFQHKIDSLKLEGRKIDARIVKMTTSTEINQAKKDSKQLSNQLVITSDAMINFMTSFKSMQTGWRIKTNNPGRNNKRIYYFDKELSTITSVK